jgi:orotidine-5'-phosphate decarboxylase
MNADQLHRNILKKKSFLCIGLDSDPALIPGFLKDTELPQYEFNKKIIEATHDLVIAYKPNLAFYEMNGAKGWEALEQTCRYIRDHYPEIFLIADGKRGDIGNTARVYAESVFHRLSCDAATLSPYMGRDSVEPFLVKDKWAILLGLTSNEGSSDFQLLRVKEKGNTLFEEVLEKTSHWGTTDNLMYVIGATKAEWLNKVRSIIPDHFLLIPGIGVQGGDLDEVILNGMNKRAGLIINVSRSVLYAGKNRSFAEAARSVTLGLQQKMEPYLIS